MYNLNLLNFVINTLKSTCQFLDWHIPFIYWIHWKQSTFHSFAIERRCHCFYYSNSFMIEVFEKNNDWIIFYSIVNKHANKQGVKTETICYINGSVMNNITLNKHRSLIFWLICANKRTFKYKIGYIELLSKYLLRSLGLRYIRVLLCIYIYGLQCEIM